MRKRKGRVSETTDKEKKKKNNNNKDEQQNQSTTLLDHNDQNNNTNNGFFSCYLLTSLNPRFKGHTYIGFTVNPRRRIRQHNGEIGCGAWRTKTKRPWEMVLCIHGFPTNISALQFEWAWQHPRESLAVREAASAFKSLSGVANKVKLAYTMLTLPSWKSLNITVNYFSTKYTAHSAKCPSLPEHMKVKVSPMDELPCYTGREDSSSDTGDDWRNSELDDTFGVSCSGGLAEDLLEASSVLDFDRRSSGSSECSNEEECQRSQTSSSSPSKGNSCQGSESADPLVEFSFPAVSSPCVIEDADCFGAFGISKPSDDAECNPGQTSRQLNSTEPYVNEDRISNTNPIVLPAENIIPRNNINFLPQVEIIDVCTPSPDCIISSCGKRRRKSSRICPDIIDLTKSPIFIQL